MKRHAAYLIVALLTFLIGGGAALLYDMLTYPCGPQPPQKKVTTYVTVEYHYEVH